MTAPAMLRVMFEDCPTVVQRMRSQTELIESLSAVTASICFAFTVNKEVAAIAFLMTIFALGCSILLNHNVAGWSDKTEQDESSAQAFMKERLENKEQLFRSVSIRDPVEDSARKLEQLCENGHQTQTLHTIKNTLQPQVFGVIAPLFFLPITWMVQVYKEERADLFVTLFLITFVAFNVSMINLNSLGDNNDRDSKNAAVRIYDATSSSQPDS